MSQTLPTIALAMWVPAGIGPELAAKAMAEPDVRAAAKFIVLGDRRLFEAGARLAGVVPDLPVAPSLDRALDRDAGTMFVDLANCDPAGIALGEVSREGGASALANFRAGIDLARMYRIEAPTRIAAPTMMI